MKQGRGTAQGARNKFTIILFSEYISNVHAIYTEQKRKYPFLLLQFNSNQNVQFS